MWWSANGILTNEILWAIVSVVGLVFAIRLRGQGKAAWFARAAFAVMLIPGVYTLSYVVIGELDHRGYAWAADARDLFPVPYLQQSTFTVGFGLLTAAIFTSRPSSVRVDADNG
jgi:hypothetical protein